jgi:hypothetical protein
VSYCWDIRLSCFRDYRYKLKVCSLLLVLLDIYVEVINMSVTHSQMLLMTVIHYRYKTFALYGLRTPVYENRH